MGVKGLLTYLNTKLKNSDISEAPRGAVLIDYNAFFFWFASTMLPGIFRSTKQYLNADYGDGCRLLSIFLELMELHELYPEFILGERLPYRSHEMFTTRSGAWRSRRQRNLERLISTEAMIDAQDFRELDRFYLDQPFTKSHFIYQRYLKCKGYMTSCIGETAVTLSWLSKNLQYKYFGPPQDCKMPPPVAFVMTNDTDFVLMPDTKVFLLQQYERSPLILHLIHQTFEKFYHDSDLAIAPNRQIPLWTNDLVAQKLYVHPSDLPALSVISGNDFTALCSVHSYMKVAQAAKLVTNLPMVKLSFHVDGEKLDIDCRDVRSLLTRDSFRYFQAYSETLQFFGVLESEKLRLRKQERGELYRGLRMAIYGLRIACRVVTLGFGSRDLGYWRDPMKNFSLKALQAYKTESVYEYLKYAQQLDIPSLSVAIASPLRLYTNDVVFDCASSMGPSPLYPKSIHCGLFSRPFRQRIYALIYNGQELPEIEEETCQAMSAGRDNLDYRPTPADKAWKRPGIPGQYKPNDILRPSDDPCKVLEWTPVDKDSSVNEHVRILRLDFECPSLTQMAMVEDAERLRLYRLWLMDGRELADERFSGILCTALAAYLNAFSPRPGHENFGTSLLISCLLMVNSNRRIIANQLQSHCLDYLSGASTWEPGEPVHPQSFTFSIPGNWAVWRDVQTLQMPLPMRNAIADIFGEADVADFLLRKSAIEDMSSLSAKLYPTCRSLAVFSRFMDAIDHVFWATLLFHLSGNTPLFFQDFISFRLYQVVALGTLSDPPPAVTDAYLEAIVPQIQDMHFIFMTSEWFLNLYTDLTEFGKLAFPQKLSPLHDHSGPLTSQKSDAPKLREATADPVGDFL